MDAAEWSGSDLFHETVPLDFLQTLFNRMDQTPGHRFHLVTKYAERLVEVAGHLPWPPNVWMGVSIESEAQLWRADALCCVPAWTRFLSLNPLLGPIDLTPVFDGWRELQCSECGERPPDFYPNHWADDDVPAFWPAEWCCRGCSSDDLSWDPQPRIHWVIAGGESGSNARPCDPAWLEDIWWQCHKFSIPFFLAHLGGHPDKRGGAQARLRGRLHRELPSWA